MGRSKVIYGGEVLVDLTGDTVTPDTLAEGVTAHNAAGEPITGTAPKITSQQVWEITLEDDTVLEKVVLFGA